MSSVQINNGSTVIGEITHDGTSLILQSKNGAPLKLKDASGNVLFDSQAPVTNSKRVVAEYIFDEDQELDYTSAIANNTTVTVSELPANTVAILAHVAITRGNVAGIYYKRSSGSTNIYKLLGGSTASGTSRFWHLVWMPTNGNSFYVQALYDVLSYFWIVGYKVAE